MSIKIMSLVWENAQVDGNNLLVLLALADWSKDDGVSWHSIPNLAAKVRISERTVQRCIAHLVNSGHLAVQRGGVDGHSTTKFRIKIEALTGGDNLTPLPAGGDKTGRGDTGDTPGVTNQVVRGDTGDTRYVNNRNTNRNDGIVLSSSVITTEDNTIPTELNASAHTHEADTYVPTRITAEQYNLVDKMNRHHPVSYDETEEPANTPQVHPPVARHPPEGEDLTPTSGGHIIVADAQNVHYIEHGRKPEKRDGSLPPDSITMKEPALQWAVEELGWRGGLKDLQFCMDNCLDYYNGVGAPKKNWKAVYRKWLRETVRRGDDLPREHMRGDYANARGGKDGQRDTTPKYGYNRFGEPTNKATALLTTAQEMAQFRAERRARITLSGEAGGDADALSDDDGGGDE